METQENNTHVARIRLVSADRDKQLLDLYHQRDGVGGGDDSLFFFDAEISNTLLDSYYTHMSEKTLRNYAEDAMNGVALLRSHDWKSLPVGYSLLGTLEQNENRQRVLAGFYVPRGLSDTNDFITRVETGILRDVSVGFFGGRTVCDVCHNDFWDCNHFPGLTYKEGDRSVVATFEIDGARLSEVSGVYDGSTPEAMIRKAEVLARGGHFTPQQIHLLENRLRVALPSSASFEGVAIPATEQEENRSMTEEQILKVRSLLGLGEEGDVVATVESLRDALDKAQKRITSLEPRAAEGEQYRKDLVEAALVEGVRAQGADFDKDLYEATLKDAPLPVIKRMRDDWAKIATQLLPAGRRSEDGQEEKKAKKVTTLHPDSAFI